MPERKDLDEAFVQAVAEKRQYKPRISSDGARSGDLGAYLSSSRKIVDIAKAISELPDGNQLDGAQRGAVLWAYYALACESADVAEQMRNASLFLRAYGRLLDEGVVLGAIEQAALNKVAWVIAKRIWKQDVRGIELRKLMQDAIYYAKHLAANFPSTSPLDSRRVFFCGLVVRLCALEKGEGGNRIAIPHEVARAYLELCDLSWNYLCDEDFARKPATEETKKATQGKVKDYPSTFEKSVAFANRCFKQHRGSDSLLPTDSMMSYLKGRLQSGKWFRLYYGSWLMYLGKADQAREYFRSVVRANLREAWSWLYLGRSYKGERERQRTCYCQALCCPVRDPTIGEGLAKKIHADLLSIGFNLKDRTEEVKAHAAGAEKLLCDGVTALWVEGVLERRDGWPHGFVRMGSTSVFVSPPVIGKYRLNAGDPIRGIAEKSFDKKKGRDGWALKSILRQV